MYAQDDEAELARRFYAEQAADQELEDYIHVLQILFAKLVNQNLACIGQGVTALYRGKIGTTEGWNFMLSGRASIQEARALHLAVMNKFVEFMNVDEIIRLSLEVHPLTFRRAKITIHFQGDKFHYCDGSIKQISNVTEAVNHTENHNKLFYDTGDAFTARSTKLFDEPYEKAIELVHASPVENPGVHLTTEKEEAIDSTLALYKEKIEGGLAYIVGVWVEIWQRT